MKIQLLENEIQNLRAVNKDPQDEFKSYLKIIEIQAEGKTIYTPWQTSTSKSGKSNIKTITSNNTKINSIELRTSYEVLRIDENDYVENENEAKTGRTIISERNNKRRRNVTNDQFINKVSLECFFHSNEINQNSAVVPGNRSYAVTTKYGKKVIVVLNSHLRGINRKLFSNSLLKCRSCLKYFSGARTNKLEYYVTPMNNFYFISNNMITRDYIC